MRKFLKRFIDNKKAIIPIWGICVCVICFFPVIYWVMNVLLDNISSTVLGIAPFEGVTASSWVLVKAVISALPIFLLIILVIYSMVNAKAQSYENS